MLETRPHFKDSIDVSGPDFVNNSISYLTPVARRQMIPFVTCCLIAIAAGAFYLAVAQPLYTGSADVMIDTRHVRAVQDISTLSDSPIMDVAEVDSQIQVFRSRQVALAVIKELKLKEDPTTLGRNLAVNRVGRTFVLRVEYTSPDPDRAAQIANEFTNSYLLEQFKSRVESARRARSWLQQRTEELRQQSVNADLATQKFKADNNLIATKDTLISEQQLKEMTTELVAARTVTAQAQARYMRVKVIIDMHQTESAVTESLSNPVINELRSKYFDASKRMSDLERKLGPDHTSVVNLKNSMRELTTLLFQELGRVAEAYKSDYEIAAVREKVLTENLARQRAIAVAANDSQVQLRQLEQKAESYKSLYQNYLQRYQEAAQQESFPMADAHVISPASAPLKPSKPRKVLIIGVSAVLGAAAGFSIGMLRERMDRVFRTIDQVHSELSVQGLGMLPALPPASSQQPRTIKAIMAIVNYATVRLSTLFSSSPQSRTIKATVAIVNYATVRLSTLFPSSPQSRTTKAIVTIVNYVTVRLSTRFRYSIDQAFSKYTETFRSTKVAADMALRDRRQALLLRYSIDQPFSKYAETLRSTKVAADVALYGQSMKVIGVVSLLPNEGKTTVAKNFASLLAREGARTLLIDADARNPTLTRKMRFKERKGRKVELFTPQLARLLAHELDSGLHILPCVYADDDPRVAAGFSAVTLRAILQNIDQFYEYVVIDLPPVGPAINARSIAPAIGAFVFVVAWGETSRGAVRSVLAKERSIREKLLGVILNKVDMDKLTSYEHFDSDGYYHKKYEKYFERSK